MRIEYQVKKYDHRIKELLNAETKVQSYLHVLVVEDYKERICWCVYIWDTRQVIESGVIESDNKDYEETSRELAWYLDSKNHKGAKTASDSWQRLNGTGLAVKTCNSEFEYLNNQRNYSVQMMLQHAYKLSEIDESLVKQYLSITYNFLYLPSVQMLLGIKELPKNKQSIIQTIISNLSKLQS